jgi:hypothetical protein
VNVHIPRLRLDAADNPVVEFERAASVDRFGMHHIVTDPAEKDHRNRVVVYDERDRPWCALPGVYVSMPASTFDHRAQRPWAYMRLPHETAQATDPDLLFSFVGSPSSRSRRRIFELRHPSAVVEEVRGFTFYDRSSPLFDERRARYKDILGRSRFILCPRGKGTSSFRIYEALSIGRIPVIISDEWVPPKGPAWETFSLRWSEGGTKGLIETLEEHDTHWLSLSAAASTAYTEFFAPDATFHRVIELCRELKESGAMSRYPHGIRNRAFVASGLDVARSRMTTPLRRIVSRALRTLDLRPR